MEFEVWAEGLDHPECVATDIDGEVYAGGEAGQLYRIGADGSVTEIGSTGGFVLGLALDAEGAIYACDLRRRELLRREPHTGEIERVSSGAPGRPFRTPNYPAFAPDGALFVTDSGAWQADDGLIFRVDCDGATRVWSEGVTGFPNACAVTPLGDALIVVESTRPSLTRIEIRDDGSAGEIRLLARFPDASVPDGLALCEDGSVVVSFYRPDALFIVGADGSVDEFARDPHGTLLAAPTGVAFAGPDRRTLVVANLGRWHVSRADVALRGARLHYPRRG